MEIGRLCDKCKQLSSLASVDELEELEQQLELALSEVRARKVLHFPTTENCISACCISGFLTELVVNLGHAG